jgi:DsbC/DsbD-like thiol-disulfide interchange protein
MRCLTAAAWIVSGMCLASAQRPADIVRWSAKSPSGDVKPGGTLKVEVTAEIESGWHLYALTQSAAGPPPLAIAVPATVPFQLRSRDIEAPPPSISADPNFGTDTHYYENRVALSLPVVAKRDAKPGKHTLPIEITFQACSNTICLRPFTQKLSVDVAVASDTKGKR